jgi:hypothetical integral membrane protein (TIGR02206 family)
MNFQLYGLPHVTVLTGCLALFGAIWWYARSGKGRLHRQRDVWIFTIVFALIEVALIGSKIASGEWDMRYNLPLHMCDISAFTILYALHSRSESAYRLGYYWGCVGGLTAMLVPNLQTITWYFVPYFIWHLFLIAGPVYQRWTDEFTLPYKSIYTTLGITILIGAVMFGLNTQLNSNYMFVNEKISSFDAIGLPDFPWFLPWLAVLTFVLFHVAWWFNRKDANSVDFK